jgi:hypothetical protein
VTRSLKLTLFILQTAFARRRDYVRALRREGVTHFLWLCSCLHLFILQTAFARRRDYGKEEREARWRWKLTRRALSDHLLSSRTPRDRHSLAAEQARRRAEIARYGDGVLAEFCQKAV